jgi:peptidyl-prolyl cis-trans isomerase D
MTRQRLTPELAERMGVGQQVINELVVDALVVQAAADEGIGVSDAELRGRIQEMREFQEDGRFTRDRYLRVLQGARIDPADFEAEMRRHLARRKMEAMIRGGAKVTEAEVRAAYERRNERVRAAWASIDVTPLAAKIAVADEDLEPYVKANEPKFTRPERRELRYVVIAGRGLAQPVTDREAEAYYTEHPAEFEQPKRVRAAHVLVRVPPVGGSEAENKAKARVEDVIRRAKAGEDFAALAREVSEDSANAQQGGDLGLVGTGELVPQFEQVAFALGKGEVSAAPVRTPFGYHAIKVLDVREGGRTPFAEAKPQIAEKLLAERVDAAARARAAEVRPALQAAGDFPAEARKLGLEPREATVGRGEVLEGVGRDREVEEAAFGMATGGVSAPLKTAAGYAIVKVVRALPAGVPPLAEIKPRVIEEIRRERAEAQAMERARALAGKAKDGDFLAVARAEGFASGELAFFSRTEPPKERGVPGSVAQAALGTAVGEVSEPVRAGASVFVAKTLERQPADPAGFEGKRAELEKQLVEQKKGLLWDQWLKARRAVAKIDMPSQPAVR